MTGPMMDQPSTASFAPRQFAGQRASGGQAGQETLMGGTAGSQSGMLQQTPSPRFQTNRPQAPAPSQGAQPSFAQMQGQGLARPNPTGSVGGDLSGAVQNALQSPSRYDQAPVQQVRDAFTGQLQQEFGNQQQHLDEEMARRGIGASSIAAGYNGDLAGQQSNAMANMNASLIQDRARTYAQDQSSALGAGQAYEGNQGQLGLGYAGLGQQGALGFGQLDLANRANQQQYGLAGQQLGLQAQKQGQDYSLGQGGLGVQQGDLALRGQLGMGNLGVQQQQVANQANQFGQDYGLRSQGQQQQYGLAQQDYGLRSQLGLGGLGLQEQQLAQSGNQFDRGLAQSGSQFDRNYGLAQSGQQNQQQQFAQSLAQQLGIATMGDRTQNRSVDAQSELAKNDLYLRIMAALGGPSEFGKYGGTPNTGDTPKGDGRGMPGGAPRAPVE
jgi:hypothetical protein